jgi:D-inositol-3-phosphate glycosyltransferase
VVKRKIAFISEHASPLAMLGGVDCGGQNVYVDQVARHLVKQGFEVDIYTRWENSLYGQVVEYAPGIRVVHVPAGPRECIPKESIFRHIEEFADNMISFILDEKISYELIHAHFWMSGYVAAFIKRTLRIPFIITFHALGKVRRMHQGAADGFPDARFSIEEMVVREADMIIAECPQDKEDLMILYFANEEKIRIIPCGFDRSEFEPANKRKARERLGLDKNGKIILQCGRMVPRKGVDNVIRGLAAMLRKQQLPVKLVIVGGESDDPDPEKTPEIGRLQHVAAEEGVSDNVIFAGRAGRDMLKHYYNAADVFVTTPWYEPFGITPLESMACGTPVIGSNVGGIKYSVAHGKTGFLVPPNDPGILGERILQVLTDEKLAKQLSRTAIKHVNASFTWKTVTRQIASIYDAIRKRRARVSEKTHVSIFDRLSFWKSKVSYQLSQ